MTDYQSRPSSGDDSLSQLRSILLMEDQQRIQQLEDELAALQNQLGKRENLLETLEPVIADLLDYKITHAREEMAEALAPIMGAAIRRQVIDAKEDVVDALYPIVGQMVSRAVAEAMRELIAKINTRLNKTFDPGLWVRRIKARLTGVSEAEMLLAEAAPFRLQSIFLISRDSGLLIAYFSVHPNEKEKDDAPVVGGMLTAIKSFVETSFAESEEGELQEIEHSNCTIRIKSGRYTYLAAIYEGVPNPALDNLMQRCHHKIHNRYYRELRKYNGNNAALTGIEAPLKDFARKIQAPNP